MNYFMYFIRSQNHMLCNAVTDLHSALSPLSVFLNLKKQCGLNDQEPLCDVTRLRYIMAEAPCSPQISLMQRSLVYLRVSESPNLSSTLKAQIRYVHFKDGGLIRTLQVECECIFESSVEILRFG